MGWMPFKRQALALALKARLRYVTPMHAPRLIPGKWIFFILAVLVAGCALGLVLWTRSTPPVKDATQRLHKPVHGIM